MQKLKIYMYNQNWVFDEPGVCEKEPFVMGSTNIITRIARDSGIKNPKKRTLILTFDDKPFNEYQCRLGWTHASENGNWYYCKEKDMSGWLCPMLLYYFKDPPKELYFRVDDGGEAPKIKYKTEDKFSIADVALEKPDGTIVSWEDFLDSPLDEDNDDDDNDEYLDNEFAEVQAFLEEESLIL